MIIKREATCASSHRARSALPRSTRATLQAPDRPSDTGPTATRTRRSVGCPTAAVIRRTWRFRPSVIESRSHAVATFLRKRMGTGRSGEDGLSVQKLDLSRPRPPIAKHHALLESNKRRGLRHALHLDQISLRVLEPRIGQAMRQTTVLGQEQAIPRCRNQGGRPGRCPQWVPEKQVSAVPTHRETGKAPRTACRVRSCEIVVAPRQSALGLACEIPMCDNAT